jgi:hypothetical protein
LSISFSSEREDWEKNRKGLTKLLVTANNPVFVETASDFSLVKDIKCPSALPFSSPLSWPL